VKDPTQVFETLFLWARWPDLAIPLQQ